MPALDAGYPCGACLLGFNADRLQYPAPFLDFVLDDRAKLIGRVADRFGALVPEALAYIGELQGFYRLTLYVSHSLSVGLENFEGRLQ